MRCKIADAGVCRALKTATGARSGATHGESDAMSCRSGHSSVFSGISRYTAQVGSPAYTSPENWAGDVYDAATDVYSLGCVLLELMTLQDVANLLTLRHPFVPSTVPSRESASSSISEQNLQDQAAVLFAQSPEPDHVLAELQKLCLQMLSPSQAVRPSAIGAACTAGLQLNVAAVMGRQPILQRLFDGTSTK